MRFRFILNQLKTTFDEETLFNATIQNMNTHGTPDLHGRRNGYGTLQQCSVSLTTLISQGYYLYRQKSDYLKLVYSAKY